MVHGLSSKNKKYSLYSFSIVFSFVIIICVNLWLEEHRCVKKRSKNKALSPISSFYTLKNFESINHLLDINFINVLYRHRNKGGAF